MGVLTKYDQIEPIYLEQSVVTYIYLRLYMYVTTSMEMCSSHVAMELRFRCLYFYSKH
jgi:hypothetical protein